MQPSQTSLPDNLKSRVSRLYIANRQFTGDDGKPVEYKRLVLEVLVKGEPFEIEYKAEKKDLAILALADQVDNPIQDRAF